MESIIEIENPLIWRGTGIYPIKVVSEVSIGFKIKAGQGV